MESKNMEVRGISRRDKKSTLFSRISALLGPHLFDGILAMAASLFYMSARDLPPLLNQNFWIRILLIYFVYRILTAAIFKQSIGQWIWKTSTSGWLSWGGNLLCAFGLAGLFYVHVVKSPIYLQANDQVKIAGFAPLGDTNWVTLPFFYTIGSWPLLYGTEVIFHGLPYKKGPPQQFIPAVTARWSMPHTKLTIEGPKTKTNFIDREKLRRCFLTYFECGEIREQTLGRHVREMKDLELENFELSWIEVDNPALPQDRVPRGFLLVAHNEHQMQQRAILINSVGAHQTLILDQPYGVPDQSATDIFHKILGSLEVHSNLNTGIALANTELSKINLKNVESIENPQLLAQDISKIQLVLLSKISVDPKDAQSFYHLGGTAFMLANHAHLSRTKRTQIASPDLLLRMNEWMAVAKPLIRSAYLYMKDIDGSGDNTTRMEQMWIETKKL